MSLRSTSRAQRLIAPLLALLITGCPSPEVPPPDGAGPGEPCDAQTQCQGGLDCQADKCVFRLCTSALDRDAACAEKLGLPQAQVECLSDGTCRERRAQLGLPCGADDQCEFGLVCEEVCVETCVSHASCRVAGESCSPREANSAQRICQPYTTCDNAPDPRGFCADALELRPEVAACEQGACVARFYEEGAFCTLDEQCADRYVCERRRCSRLCDVQCDSPLQFCAPRASEPGSACYPLSGCGLWEAPDQQCAEQSGQPARCELARGRCERLPLMGPFDAVVIRDTSASTTSCDPEALEPFAPGADMLRLSLSSQDVTTRFVGYPVAIALSEQSPPHEFARAQEVFSGQPLTPLSDDCPVRSSMQPADSSTLTPESAVSLGCGGQLWVRFVDAQGEPVPIAPQSYLSIISYTPACGPGGVMGDSYEVLGCHAETDGLCDSPSCLRCETPLLLPGRAGRQLITID